MRKLTEQEKRGLEAVDAVVMAMWHAHALLDPELRPLVRALDEMMTKEGQNTAALTHSLFDLSLTATVTVVASALKKGDEATVRLLFDGLRRALDVAEAKARKEFGRQQ